MTRVLSDRNYQVKKISREREMARHPPPAPHVFFPRVGARGPIATRSSTRPPCTPYWKPFAACPAPGTQQAQFLGTLSQPPSLSNEQISSANRLPMGRSRSRALGPWLSFTLPGLFVPPAVHSEAFSKFGMMAEAFWNAKKKHVSGMAREFNLMTGE